MSAGVGILQASGASLGLVSSETSQKSPLLAFALPFPLPEPAQFMETLKAFGLKRRIGRMQKGVKCAAELIDRLNEGGKWLPIFVTLTYRPDAPRRQKQVAQFLDHARKWAQRKGFPLRYVWVMELTKKGIPHYHVMLWIARGTRLPKPDRVGWWPWGMSRVELARSPVGYLIKYASKGDTVEALPKGARLFGCGGLTAADRKTKAYRLLPRYVRIAFALEDGPRRARGGGWLSSVTGEWAPSWSLSYDDGRIWAHPPKE